MDRHQDTKTGHDGDNRCTTVTHQWQRHANHRQYTADHTNIDKNID